MEHLEGPFTVLKEGQLNIYLLTSLLPPPISLDLLCAITGSPPVDILQVVENLVKSCLFEIAEQAVTGVFDYMPDEAARWLNLAHIYHVSKIPLIHFKEVIKAGHHCLGLNLSMDAAQYYRMALEGMEKADLQREEQKYFNLYLQRHFASQGCPKTFSLSGSRFQHGSQQLRQQGETRSAYGQNLYENEAIRRSSQAPCDCFPVVVQARGTGRNPDTGGHSQFRSLFLGRIYNEGN